MEMNQDKGQKLNEQEDNVEIGMEVLKDDFGTLMRAKIKNLKVKNLYVTINHYPPGFLDENTEEAKGADNIDGNGKPPENNGLISRSFTSYRAESAEDGMGHITGVPIVYEQPTDIGGWFEETIARGAVEEAALKDVAFSLTMIYIQSQWRGRGTEGCR